MKTQDPRIFPSDHPGTLCGNREGFVELRSKIDELLESEEGSISLEAAFPDDDFSVLLLADPQEEDTEDDGCLETSILLGAVALILTFLLVGAIQSIRWVVSLFP